MCVTPPDCPPRSETDKDRDTRYSAAIVDFAVGWFLDDPATWERIPETFTHVVRDLEGKVEAVHPIEPVLHPNGVEWRKIFECVYANYRGRLRAALGDAVRTLDELRAVLRGPPAFCGPWEVRPVRVHLQGLLDRPQSLPEACDAEGVREPRRRLRAGLGGPGRGRARCPGGPGQAGPRQREDLPHAPPGRGILRGDRPGVGRHGPEYRPAAIRPVPAQAAGGIGGLRRGPSAGPGGVAARSGGPCRL
jgi:hypothetical protein